ncbi:hypothetical protein AX15_000675 [Amanita polypyramis BW_CC]|nr:hypothetical protein AX15_000675 [Amanita polypyramis BW_CC]
MTDKARQPIPSNPSRWTPNHDPASIQVPGLDTTAPTRDQIEQIEQLITIKLQNIDENFARIHSILANRILPAVKRYAVATEPVREAAKFWSSFYEQAAQIRIPTFDDHETVNENTESEREAFESMVQDHSNAVLENQSLEPSMAATENSFMPGQHAYSSTPATARATRIYDASDDQSTSDTSWAASLESPFVRLDREVQNLTREGSIIASNIEPGKSSIEIDDAEDSADHTVRIEKSQIFPQNTKGKGRDDQSILRSVLQQNLFSVDAGRGDAVKSVSPLKLRGKIKTPVPKKFNPYLPASVEPEKWDGLVDLSNATPRGLKGKARATRPTTPIKEDEDESFDGLPPGMSPPVLMSPAKPPRSSAELGLFKLGKTPGREASARISNDLVREIQQKSAQARRMFGYPIGGAESSISSSTVPTPPSLSRYTRREISSTDSMMTDASLESMMRRVGLGVGEPELAHGHEPRGEDDSFDSLDNSGIELDVGLGRPLPPMHINIQEDPEPDSDSDSLDEINNTAHPSAAFLMASQGRGGDDDSFGSSGHSDDSLIAEEAANLGIAPIHPFARGMGGNEFEGDDSFEDDSMIAGGGETQEETLFGVPPAERLRAEQLRAANQGQLRLSGQDLLEDTIGISSQLARRGRVEETPTPALPWDRRQV